MKYFILELGSPQKVNIWHWFISLVWVEGGARAIFPTITSQKSASWQFYFELKPCLWLVQLPDDNCVTREWQVELCRHVAPFWNQSSWKEIGVEIDAKFLTCWSPVKFSRGVGKISEWILSAQPKIQLPINFWWSVSRPSRRLIWRVRQVAQLSQRDGAAAWIVLAKSGRWYSADIIGLSSTTACDVIDPQSYRIRWNSVK